MAATEHAADESNTLNESTAAATPPAKRKGDWWVPKTVLLLAALAIAALWLYPSDDFERVLRVVFSLLTATASVLMIVAWFFISGAFSGRVKLAAAVLLAALAVVLPLKVVRRVDFTGSMVPIFVFHWSPTADDRLEAARQADAATEQPLAVVDVTLRPGDFPDYRGLNREGVVPEGPALFEDLAATPPREVWRQLCGAGYAGFTVAGDALVTIEQRRNEEAVVAYDRATGRERWIYKQPAFFDEAMGGPGPRATPVVVDGDVYALGATGLLVRLDGATGDAKWSTNILADASATNLPWAMSGSPLVYDRFVVVNPGGTTEGNGVVAYDRETGKKTWGAGGNPAAYSSPVLTELAGVKQVVVF
ncbi:MAG: PQQ-binding-like beta-propeller repeat protein, partial [Planctomycetia bacterium]